MLGIVVLGGCSSKIRLFIRANVDPLQPKNLVLNDGYRATYYSVHAGKHAQGDTILLMVSGSRHVSLNYYLRSYFEELDANVEIFALQKNHVNHRETGIFEAAEACHHDNHFSQWVQDQQEFIREILTQRNFSNSRVILFGVSEGGDTAAAVAAAIPHIVTEISF